MNKSSFIQAHYSGVSNNRTCMIIYFPKKIRPIRPY